MRSLKLLYLIDRVLPFYIQIYIGVYYICTYNVYTARDLNIILISFFRMMSLIQNRLWMF